MIKRGGRMASLAATVGLLAATPAWAGLIYVDASTSNTGPSDRITGSPSAGDDLWHVADLTGAAWSSSENLLVANYLGGDSEDAAEITTTISGLVAGQSYQIYVHYWDKTGTAESWNVAAGLSSGNTQLFDDAAAQVLASSLTYDAAPTDMDKVSSNIFMYVGDLGVAQADINGQIVVYIDDLADGGQNARTTYDGVSYELVPEPASLAIGLVGGLAMLRRRVRG